MTIVGLVVANQVKHGAINWVRCFDYTGFGFMIDQMQQTLHTESVSIGASPFDPTKAPILFHGLTLTREWVFPRLMSLLTPLLLLPVAAFCFHRFDPVRTKRVSGKGHRNWIGKIQNLFKPLSRRATSLLMVAGRGGSFIGAIWTDAALTFTLHPFVFVAFVVITVMGLFGSPANLPLIFATLAVIVSDVSTRDGRAGTTASVRSINRLRENYVWWKLGSTCVLSFLLCAAPLFRTVPRGGLAFLAVLTGIAFVAATATALGVVTANPKTFIVGFLTFWYVVVNDKGQNPIFDFGGFYGKSTTSTIGFYAAISAGAIVLAQLFYRARLARE
jgi:hypothetical protein